MIRVLAIAILALLLLDASSEVARVQGGAETLRQHLEFCEASR